VLYSLNQQTCVRHANMGGTVPFSDNVKCHEWSKEFVTKFK